GSPRYAGTDTVRHKRSGVCAGPQQNRCEKLKTMKRPRENGEIKTMADPDLAILGQYALAKITRRSERAPHLMHFPSSRSAFIGMLRMVALVSSLTRSSHSPEPHQCDQRKPPSPSRISLNLNNHQSGTNVFPGTRAPARTANS